MNNTLNGIKVIELSTFIAVPACARFFADLGADVIKIEAAGGEIWDDVVKFTTGRGLTGIEAMAKIPGTAGAAPVQNIGAYGQEIAQTLETVEAYDTLIDEIGVLNSCEKLVIKSFLLF